jgi:hypothetical protein
MAAVVLTEDQVTKLLRQINEQKAIHGLVTGAVLRSYKDADGKTYRLEFMTMDVTNYKDIVEPLLPKEIG